MKTISLTQAYCKKSLFFLDLRTAIPVCRDRISDICKDLCSSWQILAVPSAFQRALQRARACCQERALSHQRTRCQLQTICISARVAKSARCQEHARSHQHTPYRQAVQRALPRARAARSAGVVISARVVSNNPLGFQRVLPRALSASSKPLVISARVASSKPLAFQRAQPGSRVAISARMASQKHTINKQKACPNQLKTMKIYSSSMNKLVLQKLGLGRSG